MQYIELKLKTLTTSSMLKNFTQPKLTLSESKNVGVIVGGAGNGNTYLAVQVIEQAIKQNVTIHYMGADIQKVSALDPTDLAANTLINLSKDNPTQIHFISHVENLPVPSSKTLLVIDEFSIQLSLLGSEHSQFTNELYSYIEKGGLLILTDTKNSAILDFLNTTSCVGFTATSGSLLFSNSSNESPLEAVVINALQKKAKTRYTWFCESRDQLGFGAN